MSIAYSKQNTLLIILKYLSLYILITFLLDIFSELI